jgi:hypothetical protein
MLDLATKRKSDLEKWFKIQGKDGVEKMANILFESGLCGALEARWLIMPALISAGIVIGETVMPTEVEPDLSLKNQ